MSSPIKALCLGLTVAGSLVFGNAFAEENAELDALKADPTKWMQSKGYICMSCHQVEVKVLGPSYKEVAAKYQGEETAAATLKEKIKDGGVGNWGQIPMPPNPNVTDEDLDTIIAWIMSLAPAAEKES